MTTIEAPPMGAHRVVSGSPTRPSTGGSAWKRIAIPCLVLVLDLGLSFLGLRFTLPAAAVALFAVLWLAMVPAPTPINRRAALLIGANVALLFGYLWSLDEHVPLTLTPLGTHYRLRVGGDVLTIPVRPKAGGVGVYTGLPADYAVHPTGDIASFATGIIPAIGAAMREFGPASAFADVTIDRRRVAGALPGGATRNRRGEIVPAPGTGVVWKPASGRVPVIGVELYRPEGLQGLTFGIDSRGNGYVAEVRLDAHTAIDPGDSRAPVNVVVYRWNKRAGPVGEPLARYSLHHPNTLQMVQRDARIVLSSVLVGWLLLLFALLAARLLAAVLVERETSEGKPRARLLNLGVRALPMLVIEVELIVTAFISAAVYRIPHIPDSVAYMFQAKTLALGHLEVPAPALPQFFAEPFLLLYHGHWFGKYPVGWPLLLAAGVKAGAPWIVNPVLGAATLILIYRLGIILYSRNVARLGLVFAAGSPLFVALSFSFMAHVSTLFFLTSFAYLYARWALREEQEAAKTRTDAVLLLLAGFALGFAFIIRQLDAIAFGLPWLLFAYRRPIVSRLRFAAIWLTAGGIWPAGVLLGYNWRLTGSPLRNPYTLYWSFDHLGFGANTGNEVFTFAHGLWNTSFNLESLEANLFGWPFYVAVALMLIPFLAGRARRTDWLLALGIVTIIGAYVLYYGPGVAMQPRCYSAALPWFAFLAARGIQELVRLPQTGFLGLRPLSSAASRVLPLALVAFLALYDIGYYWPSDASLYPSYGLVSTKPIDAVAREHIHNAVVFVAREAPYPGQKWSWQTYPQVFSSNSPLLNSDVVYAIDRGKEDQQLMRLYPGRTYYRLLEIPTTQVPRTVVRGRPRFIDGERFIEIKRISPPTVAVTDASAP